MSTEENKRLVRRWLVEVHRGDPAIIEEFLAPEYMDHNPPPSPNLAPGRDGAR